MFLRKKFRDANKTLKKEKEFHTDSDGDALINVKAENSGQIFSAYNFDKNEKLNSELGDFIYDKAKYIPTNQDLRIKIYSLDSVDEKEVIEAVRDHYKRDYIEVRNEMKRALIFSVVMLILGSLSFALWALMYKFFYNIYADFLIEIIAWVFIWEAVYGFFLDRNKLKQKRKVLLNLYSAEIDVVFVNIKNRD